MILLKAYQFIPPPNTVSLSFVSYTLYCIFNLLHCQCGKCSSFDSMAFPMPLKMQDNVVLIIMMVSLGMLVSASTDKQATTGKDPISLYCITAICNTYVLKIYVLVAIYISCKMSISKEFGQKKQQQEILKPMWNAQTAVIVGIA